MPPLPPLNLTPREFWTRAAERPLTRDLAPIVLASRLVR